MSFKMKFDSGELKGPQPVPQGIYEVRFLDFKPKISAKGTSTNLNPQVEIVNHPDYHGRRIFTNLNTSIPAFIQDFVHSFGMPMEDQQGDDPQIPGDFEGSVDDPSTWKYIGPLTGKVATWEIGIRDYQGKEQNDVRRFVCSVPNCASEYPLIRHSADMQRKAQS